MLMKINMLLIVGLSFFYSPLHSKDISKSQESLSYSAEEIAEEMKILNSNLKSISNTISNLVH